MSKKFSFTREVFHEILFIISLLLSLLLFWGLANWIVASIIFAAFGFALEIEKRYLSRAVKRYFIDKNWKSLIPNATVLLVIVILSAIASYGSMKSAIYKSIHDIEQLNGVEVEEIDVANVEFQIEQIDSKIQRLNNSITSAQNEQTKMNNNDIIFIPSMERMEAIVNENEAKIDTLLDERTDLSNLLKKVDNVESNVLTSYLSSSNTFKMIADDFGWEIDSVMSVIIYVLVIILELSLFLTVYPLDNGEKEVKRDEKELFEKFIYELFNNNGRKYLNSVNKACAGAGISSGQGKTWMAMLLEIKMRGSRPLISKESGGYVSSFPVSTVVNVAKKALFMEEVIK